MRKHSYLGIWYHIHGRLQLQSLASIPQGAARGKKLGHLFFSFKEPFVFEERKLFHFLTFCDFRSSVQDQGLYSFEQKTARALAKKILLTEFRPEALAKKQVNVTDLYPMVSSTNYAQTVPLH